MCCKLNLLVWPNVNLYFLRLACFNCNQILDTSISFLLYPWTVRNMLPPWILKLGGLESSGQRLISLNGKTKITMIFVLTTKKCDYLMFQVFQFLCLQICYKITQPLGTDKITQRPGTKKSPNLLEKEKNHPTSWEKKKSTNLLGQKKITQPLRTKKIT